MKQIVILGAGTAGTMVANHLSKKNNSNWQITVIDQFEKHYYQPGFLFMPFGIYKPKDVIKKKSKFLPKKVNYIQSEIDKVEPDSNKVLLKDGQSVDYDLLVIATGSKIAPSETTGLKDKLWHKEIFDFYTFEGSEALSKKLPEFKEGTLVVNIVEMPIKCPVAPLEFSFLADWYFRKQGVRDNIKIKYVTPLDGAFTKPQASESLGYLLKQKDIEIIPDYSVEHVDNDNKKLVSYDEKEVPFDLLVTIPTNMGDEMIARSGLGDDLNFVPTNQNTLQSDNHENIFVIGDATNVPASKAGSVAHFQAETLIDNVEHYLNNEELEQSFDGHANCFVETGDKKALLIDFNYDTEPLKGKFPFAGVGPMNLLSESRLNHIGKLSFRWIYWNILLKGRTIPFVPSQMSKKGKQFNNKNKEPKAS